MTAITKPKKRGPMDLVLISYFSFLVISTPAGILNIAWTYMQGTFEVSIENLGALLTASVLGGLITSFASGRVVGKLGVGWTLILATVLHLSGLGVIALSPTWIVLLVGSFVAGMGSGLVDTGMNTIASERYSTGQMNWMHACFGIGQTIGPIIMTFIVVSLNQSWRLGYGLAVALDITLLLILLATRNRWKLGLSTANGAGTGDEVVPSAPIMKTLAVPMVLMSMAFFFVYAGVEVGAGQLSNTLFLDGWGIDQATAGTWVSMYWGAFTIGRILIGLVADRIANNLIIRLSIIGSVVGAALLWLHPSNDIGAIGLLVLGFSQAPIFATVISDTPLRVRPEHVANAIGFQVGFASLGIAVLPGLGGILAARMGAGVIAPFLLVVLVGLFFIYEFIVMRERRIQVTA
ncbi:MAG: MFS transporter [Anaerolineae bacterium]|nr:MFS transporter [Anaerolineae bacterium]